MKPRIETSRPRSHQLALQHLARLTMVFTLCSGFAAPAQQPISLSVDATNIARKMFHAALAIPVRPGPLTLVYPKWIPGYHAPVGPINNIVRLKMSGNGQPLEWNRDLVDMFAFRVVVPDTVRILIIAMDIVAPTRPRADLGAATAQLFVLEWNQVLLYPYFFHRPKTLAHV